MKKFKASAFIIISAFFLLLSVQPGIGADAAETGGISGTWKGKWTIPNGGSPGTFEAVKEQE